MKQLGVVARSRASSVSLAFLGLLAVSLAASCGGKLPQGLECGRGQDLFFAYQRYVGPEQEPTPERRILDENGVEFLIVDGACNYWVFYPAGRHQTWSPVHEGRLTAEQLNDLNESLIQQSWPSLAVKYPAARINGDLSDGNYLWQATDVAYCLEPCQGSLEPLTTAARRLTRELYDQSQPARDPAMHWLVIRATADALPAFPGVFAEWTGETVLDSISLSTDEDQAAYFDLGYGDYGLVPANDRPLLRALWSQSNPTFLASGFLGALENGIPYQIYARDAVPFEDDRGLFRPPVP